MKIFVNLDLDYNILPLPVVLYRVAILLSLYYRVAILLSLYFPCMYFILSNASKEDMPLNMNVCLDLLIVFSIFYPN